MDAHFLEMPVIRELAKYGKISELPSDFFRDLLTALRVAEVTYTVENFRQKRPLPQAFLYWKLSLDQQAEQWDTTKTQPFAASIFPDVGRARYFVITEKGPDNELNQLNQATANCPT